MRLLALLLVVGCGSMPHTRVRTVADVAELPPKDQATVVFIRHGTYGLGHKQPFFLADGDGRFLGELPGNSRLHLTVPAGRHKFVGWFHTAFGGWGPASLVTAELRAGQVAQVLVQPDHYGLELIAIPMENFDCSNVPDLLTTRRVGVDPSPDPAMLPPQKLREQVREAQSYFDDLGEQAKLRRRIVPVEFGYSAIWGPKRPPANDPVLAIQLCMQANMIAGETRARMLEKLRKR